MMINAQISIQILSAKGPPLIITLKDVHNFEIQAEEPFFSCADDVQMPSSPLLPTLHTHITTHTLVPPPLYFFYRQNPQKHLLSRSKCQLIILPKHVFNWSTGEQLESGFSRHGARRMKAKVGRGGGAGRRRRRRRMGISLRQESTEPSILILQTVEKRFDPPL